MRDGTRHARASVGMLVDLEMFGQEEQDGGAKCTHHQSEVINVSLSDIDMEMVFRQVSSS